jgi:site-specific DNA-methyltransferase (cytosine-N4-specific)
MSRTTIQVANPEIDTETTLVTQAITNDTNACCEQPSRRGRMSKLRPDQLRFLNDLLQLGATSYGFDDDRWTPQRTAELIKQHYGITYHPNYIPRVLRQVQQALADHPGLEPYFHNSVVSLYRGEAAAMLGLLPTASVDCIVTSPPYYGQRDYGVPDQIGLEKHPQEYIERLLQVFRAAKRVLKPTGSLWVNLGDTYWSGKGRPQGPDAKQPHRRFLRPQDVSGPRPLCTPKQLLLIPHRFAIAMQDEGWIVRNDNVWYKVNPTPDPVDDRCAAAHEYMFHFVLKRKYYFDTDAVAIPSQGEKKTKAPPSVWMLRSAPTFKKHIAVFPEELVRVPILATLPRDGVILDPFCGSGTALSYAIAQGDNRRGIGIDISETALEEAQTLLSQLRIESRVIEE